MENLNKKVKRKINECLDKQEFLVAIKESNVAVIQNFLSNVVFDITFDDNAAFKYAITDGQVGTIGVFVDDYRFQKTELVLFAIKNIIINRREIMKETCLQLVKHSCVYDDLEYYVCLTAIYGHYVFLRALSHVYDNDVKEMYDTIVCLAIEHGRKEIPVFFTECEIIELVDINKVFETALEHCRYDVACNLIDHPKLIIDKVMIGFFFLALVISDDITKTRKWLQNKRIRLVCQEKALVITKTCYSGKDIKKLFTCHNVYFERDVCYKNTDYKFFPDELQASIKCLLIYLKKKRIVKDLHLPFVNNLIKQNFI